MVDIFSNMYAVYPLMLFFGTFTILFSNLQVRAEAMGSYGDVPHKFDKPWFQNNQMFISMSLAMLGHFAMKRNAKNRSASINTVELETPKVSKVRQYCVVAIPAFFDLVGSAFMTAGMVKSSPSIMQMMRGSMIIFSAIFSVAFLKRKLKIHNYLGIFFATIAISLVGVASVMGGTNYNKDGFTVFIGCCLVILSQFVQAGQIVTEEFLLKGIDLPPLVIVGMEGVWGLLFQVAIATPILYAIPGPQNGHYEDDWDALVMLGNSSKIAGYVAGFMLVVLWYNIFGMMVTCQQSAIHRTILEACRTACIWVVDIFVYYVVPGGRPYGESWNDWCFLQLAGFCVLIFSMFLYENNVPFLDKYLEPAPIQYQALDAPFIAEDFQNINTIPTSTPVGKHSRMPPPPELAPY